MKRPSKRWLAIRRMHEAFSECFRLLKYVPQAERGEWAHALYALRDKAVAKGRETERARARGERP